MAELIQLIRERIGMSENDKFIDDYDGFDMSKTHDMDASGTDEHNKKVIEQFDDFLDVDYICSHLDCWKGAMFWKEDWYDTFRVKDFCGFGSEEIIEWLIKNKGTRTSRVISKETRYRILKEQKWRCNECGCLLKFSKNSDWDGKIAHIDHIHPFAERFTYLCGIKMINERENLQALCQECNSKKRKNKA